MKPEKADSKHLTWEEARDIANADKQRQASQRAKSKDSPSTHTDEILESIDEALEGIEAETFVRDFQQQGGE